MSQLLKGLLHPVLEPGVNVHVFPRNLYNEKKPAGKRHGIDIVPVLIYTDVYQVRGEWYGRYS